MKTIYKISYKEFEMNVYLINAIIYIILLTFHEKITKISILLTKLLVLLSLII